MFYLTAECSGVSLPQPFLDRYRMADSAALKTAIYILGGGDADAETISDALSIPVETVGRALNFWCSAGLLAEQPTSGEPANKTQTPVSAPAAEPKRVRSSMTPERAAELSLRDPQIAVLLQETQRFLGRTLDTAESRTLLELYEYDELSVEIILMLVAYCVPRVRNKRALCSMVSRIADDWFEQGISTTADAEKQIKLLELREQREAAVAKVLEMQDPSFSKSQKAIIAKWFEEYHYDESFVREAYLSKGNASIAYIGKILQSWYNSGYQTIKDVLAAGSAANAPAAPSASRKKSGGSLLKKAVRTTTKEES